MADLIQTIPPYYESFVMEDEHPNRKVGFICRTCGRPVDDGPCPDHAPLDVPGLALVDCEATPRHWVWTLASDANGYGNPCTACILAEEYDRRRQARERRTRRWVARWRYWALTNWVASWAYRLGVISGYGIEMRADGSRVSGFGFDRHQRPYVLGVSQNTWRCWLVGHHRRGESVAFGFCGKCMPWNCCGSQRAGHEPGCKEV